MKDAELTEPDVKMDKYQELTRRTAFYPNRGNNLTYPILGLCGEAGEVANLVKKIERDDGGTVTDKRKIQLMDELGDVLWYIAASCDELGVKMSDIAALNLLKLETRHAKPSSA